ncbi:MAG: gamma-glutamyl-gamma-aminobutyrate hydrolase family protein [Gemmataceae bacterium]
MFNVVSKPAIRLAIYGSEVSLEGKGIGLWNVGYQATIEASGAEPVFLDPAEGDASWSELLEDMRGVVVCGFTGQTQRGDLESLCLWCRENKFPVLGVDQGMLALNAACGGLNYANLPKELPEALQHRHPPEPGLRHAINVQSQTLLAHVYGEGEIVVNSEHREAVQRVAPGFRIGGVALDGVIESIEWNAPRDWFALGIQWQPATASASGLDIQVFRALIDAHDLPAPRASTRKARRMAVAG